MARECILQASTSATCLPMPWPRPRASPCCLRATTSARPTSPARHELQGQPAVNHQRLAGHHRSAYREKNDRIRDVLGLAVALEQRALGGLAPAVLPGRGPGGLDV